MDYWSDIPKIIENVAGKLGIRLLTPWKGEEWSDFQKLLATADYLGSFNVRFENGEASWVKAYRFGRNYVLYFWQEERGSGLDDRMVVLDPVKAEDFFKKLPLFEVVDEEIPVSDEYLKKLLGQHAPKYLKKTVENKSTRIEATLKISPLSRELYITVVNKRVKKPFKALYMPIKKLEDFEEAEKELEKTSVKGYKRLLQKLKAFYLYET